jgi:hypothetical protein
LRCQIDRNVELLGWSNILNQIRKLFFICAVLIAFWRPLRRCQKEQQIRKLAQIFKKSIYKMTNDRMFLLKILKTRKFWIIARGKNMCFYKTFIGYLLSSSTGTYFTYFSIRKCHILMIPFSPSKSAHPNVGEGSTFCWAEVPYWSLIFRHTRETVPVVN